MATANVMMPAIPGRKPRGWTAAPLISDSPQTSTCQGPFDASKHLAFTPPSKVYTMADLSLPADTGVSPIAVSEPFPLFTEEAVERMRAEVFSDEVMNCKYSSNLAHCQLRGFANKYAPFIYDAWKNPETLRIISEIAGIDLVTQMDFEIAHINLSFKSEEQSGRELQASKSKRNANDDDDTPIVGWHTDSYPFVCVAMLSDCTKMIGGETALRTGTGEIMKVRGPQKGCAVVLQGRYIEHQALAALGNTERITMVTSFRPRSPLVRDDTVLTTVRAISDLSELYGQFSEYRLEILEERIRRQLKELREAKGVGRAVATARLKSFFKEQEKFLAHMNHEVLENEMVTVGEIDDSHLLTKGEPKGQKRFKRRVR
ncbi:hypothetical protein GQ53DRAFT_521888 [Thozetella sp. PMI_491]|nr:hypothetical protein GQ53DRAFT_521888 [Thozetella sp. PMI_491]